MGLIIPFIPTSYQMRIRGTFVPQVIIFANWLKFEAMPQWVLQEYPILHEMRGWRTKECHDYVASYDWTARMYE